MTYFVELLPRYVDPDEYRLGLAAVKTAAHQLGIPPPVLRWFIGPATQAHGIKAELAGEGFESTPNTIGYAMPFPEEAWVRAGRDRLQLINTIGHEVEHIRQARHSETKDEVARERKAYRFGEKFADEFRARPSGIKSAMLTAHDLVDEDWRFTASARVPGLKPWTDLAPDFYPGPLRPLVVDRVVGKRAERVGWVDEVLANDEAIFMRGQLDLSDRYRAHIARLVEQGKLTFGADTLSSGNATELAGKSYRRWPLAIVTMRPMDVAG